MGLLVFLGLYLSERSTAEVMEDAGCIQAPLNGPTGHFAHLAS